MDCLVKVGRYFRFDKAAERNRTVKCEMQCYYKNRDSFERQTDRQTDRQTERKKDRRTDGRTDGRTDRYDRI